jgi:phosphatidylglycerophosphate synthase
MLDGMVAIEGGKQTKSGAFYNEFPDRISDFFILMGFGLAIGASFYGLALGSISASLALLCAYVRALGASLHGGQDFSGPMAKPDRMALVTAISVLLLLPGVAPHSRALILAGNWLLIIGTSYTIFRRCRNLLRKLEQA